MYTVWGVYSKETGELDVMFESKGEAEFYKRQLEQDGGSFYVDSLLIPVDASEE